MVAFEIMETVWKTVRGQLKTASDREFERTALHYLRIIWPMLIQSPMMQRLDRFGVDMCELESDGDFNGHFKVVIQAKGFKVDEQLLMSQVEDQILPSIKKFLDSPLTCDHYVLLHNREGSNRELAAIIQEHLDYLIQAGKAKSVQLWDCHSFIKDVRNQLEIYIRAKLTKQSLCLLKQHSNFFYFGDLFVSQVPFRQFKWKPDELLSEEFIDSEFINTDITPLISSPREARYSLLIGSFGVGKTTATLRTTNVQGLLVIHVPAYAINRKQGSQGTNFLLRNLNDELDLLDDFLPETVEILKDLMGAALGRILRKADDQFVLVIDGLDEHPFYGTAYGLQWLTNELAELRCPIVLTTRREHFLSLISNYGLAFEALSKKNGARRPIDILELGAWRRAQAHELLEQVRAALPTDAPQLVNLNRLSEQLDSPSTQLSASLLSHPLFLQMTLDLIMEGEDWLLENEDSLIETWIRKKIKRDFRVPRLNNGLMLDIESYVEGMIEAMVQIAVEMQQGESSTLCESDTISAQNVLVIVRKSVDIPNLDIATVLMTSLLVPLNRRLGKPMQVKFFHRSIQEFLVRRNSAVLEALG